MTSPPPKDWSQLLLQTMPPRLVDSGLSAQLVGIALVAVQNALFQAYSESVLQRCQQLDISPDDVLPVLSLEAGLPQYPDEPNASFRDRLTDKWGFWPTVGRPDTLIAQLALAGIPNAYIVYDLPGGGHPEWGIPSYPNSSEWWSQFIVRVPLAASIGTGADGRSVLLSQQQLDVVRTVILKFKPADWVCREIVVNTTGGDPTYDDVRGYRYDTSGITWLPDPDGNGPIVERFSADNSYTVAARTVSY